MFYSFGLLLRILAFFINAPAANPIIHDGVMETIMNSTGHAGDVISEQNSADKIT